MVNVENLLDICNMEENNEIWKPIAEYEEQYLISNKGNVKSLKTDVYLTPNLHDKKYLRVSLYKNNKRKHYKLHRLVAIAFIENPNNKPEVNHKDGNKMNNNDWNLEWSTNQENTDHAVLNNLHSSLITRKLSYDDIIFIFENPALGYKKLSKKFNVSRSVIQRVRKNKIYKRDVNTYHFSKSK